MSVGIIDANPLSSCIMGGKETIIVLEESVDKNEVEPIFQVYSRSGGRRADLERHMIQPTKNMWGPSTVLSFTSPPQPHLENIGEEVVIKLTISDKFGNTSQKMFEYKYSSHKPGPGQYNGQRCIHCSSVLE